MLCYKSDLERNRQAMRAHAENAEVQEEACLALYTLAYERDYYRQVLVALSCVSRATNADTFYPLLSLFVSNHLVGLLLKMRAT